MSDARARMDACLDAIARHESDVRAFTWLDTDRARALAATADEADPSAELPLLGVPLGVKDIFDTAGIPTEHGSALFRGRTPACTAPVVAALEAAGALLVGKLVTTEFAGFEPGPTRNPWDLSRTTGGSSMGSAAAVAAGFVDLAVGSQTQGSVIRPAAFCGVVGFKPSHGVLSTDGVLQVAPTLDTVGLFARTVPGIVAAFDAITGGNAASGDPQPDRLPRFAIAHSEDLGQADDAARERFEADIAAVRASGAEVLERPFPPVLEATRETILTIQDAEAAWTLGPVVAGHDDLVSERVRRQMAAGAQIPAADYEAALRLRDRMRDAWSAWASDVDAVLTIPAVGEAPAAEAGTGDPRFCWRWTLVGAPAITLPTGLGPSRMPLGLQVVGLPGRDSGLLHAAGWLERLLPPIGRPTFRDSRPRTAG